MMKPMNGAAYEQCPSERQFSFRCPFFFFFERILFHLNTASRPKCIRIRAALSGTYIVFSDTLCTYGSFFSCSQQSFLILFFSFFFAVFGCSCCQRHLVTVSSIFWGFSGRPCQAKIGRYSPNIYLSPLLFV